VNATFAQMDFHKWWGYPQSSSILLSDCPW
jgi:hypothetical protein